MFETWTSEGKVSSIDRCSSGSVVFIEMIDGLHEGIYFPERLPENLAGMRAEYTERTFLGVIYRRLKVGKATYRAKWAEQSV